MEDQTLIQKILYHPAFPIVVLALLGAIAVILRLTFKSSDTNYKHKQD